MINSTYGDDLNESMKLQSTQLYIADQSEKYLFAFLATEGMHWLPRIASEESDKCVMIATKNHGNCVVLVELPDIGPVACH